VHRRPDCRKVGTGSANWRLTQNSGGTVRNLRPFPKGLSGNPGGRPRVLAEIRALARTYTEPALLALVEIMQHGRNESARVAAAQAVLDRGWGRPVQALEHSGHEGSALLPADLTVLPDAQLTQLSALLEDIASQARDGSARPDG
jgi:hypothetical protein